MISVAIATYNGAKFLREQLDSIYNQTYKNIEVIACDDCSTDKTVEILDEYKNKHGLKYFVNKKNLGFVKNFEKAITLCTGDYIALCDQDDIWKEEKLEYLLARIGKNDLIYSDAELINENGEVFSDSFMRYTSLQYTREDQFERLLYGNFAQGASMLFRSSLKDEFLPFPEGIPYHDWWIALVASAYDGIKCEETSLIQYRIHDKNDTGAVNFSNYRIREKLKYYCQNEEKMNEIWINRKEIIQSAKLKFKVEKKEIILKAEKYNSISSKRENSILFLIFRFLFLSIFFIKNKYIFKPKLSYIAYISNSFRDFLLSNRFTKYIYQTSRNKHKSL